MKKKNKWRENQAKAEAMTDKFIAAIEKLDCYDSWEVIMVERIINKMVMDDATGNKYDGIQDMLETTFGFKTFRVDSLVEEMKIEQFLQELKENPYQLKLIA